MSAPRWLPAGWNDRQRGFIACFLLALVAYLSVRLLVNPRFVSDPQPAVPERAAQLADRIDPNSADVPALAALPMIGEKRARAIVTYREEFEKSHPGERAFKRIADLDQVRGIGPIIVEQLEPYLLFDKKPPTTRP